MHIIILSISFRLTRIYLFIDRNSPNRYKFCDKMITIEYYFTSRHEIHRLQDLQRAYLAHCNSSVKMHRRFGAIASDASNKVRSSVDQSPQEIV